MLQAMYQVIDSRRSYKEFLYGIFYKLRAQLTEGHGIPSENPVKRTEAMAAVRAFNDRVAGLDPGTAVGHFVFNYLDHLLCRAYIV